MSEENVEIVRRAYEAVNRWGPRPFGSPESEIPALLHPEVEFHTYMGAPEAGVYRGRDAVVEYHRSVFGQFESLRLELEELLSAGDRVVVISRQHTVPKGGEAEIVQQVVEVWTIRDGLLAERRSYSTKDEALEAAGLQEYDLKAAIKKCKKKFPKGAKRKKCIKKAKAQAPEAAGLSE